MIDDDKKLSEQLRAAADDMDKQLFPLARMYTQLADRIDAYEVAIKRLASENEKMLEALLKYDDLVNYEYEGSPEAIAALQEASSFAFDVMGEMSNG